MRRAMHMGTRAAITEAPGSLQSRGSTSTSTIEQGNWVGVFGGARGFYLPAFDGADREQVGVSGMGSHREPVLAGKDHRPPQVRRVPGEESAGDRQAENRIGLHGLRCSSGRMPGQRSCSLL